MRTNFFFKIDEKAEKLATEKGLKRAIWIVTNKCNLSCGFCYADSQLCHGYKLSKLTKMDELSTDECFKAVDKFHEAGIKGIVVGGGEPMLRPDLFEIAKYAKGKGMSLSIATNGTLINEDNCKDISSIFKRIELPLDGFENTHNSLRGKTYSKICNSIDLVKNKMYTSVCTLALEENMQELPAFLDKVISPMEINEYRLMRLTMLGRGKSEDYPGYVRKYLETDYKLIDRFKNISKGKIVIEDAPLIYNKALWSDSRVEFQPCAPGLNAITVLPDGYLTLCPVLEKTGIRAGHILKDDIHEAFYKSEIFEQARNRTECDGCGFYKNPCYGGCVCATVAGGKKVNQRDPSCPGPDYYELL